MQNAHGASRSYVKEPQRFDWLLSERIRVAEESYLSPLSWIMVRYSLLGHWDGLFEGRDHPNRSFKHFHTT